MIRILIIDDHTVVRQGLAMILEKSGEMKVVGSYANAGDAIDWLSRNDCNVAILDIALPDISGIDLLNYFRKIRPVLPILILSAYPEDQYAVRLIKAGASGYLNKECAPEEIQLAVKSVLNGKRYVSSAVVEMLAREVSTPSGKLPHEALSKREYQIFMLIVTANSTATIAEKLKLSVKTIGTYRSRILEKMQMHSSVELARYAVEHNLLK